MLTNNKWNIFLSPQKYETRKDKLPIAKKKSINFAIKINKTKKDKVKKNGLSNFSCFFQEDLNDK